MADGFVLVRVQKHTATASLHWWRWSAEFAAWRCRFFPDLTKIRYTYVLSVADWLDEIRQTREHIEYWNAMIRKSKGATP